MASLGFPSVSVCVHNGRSNISATAELAEYRKITFKKKNTISNEHPVCDPYLTLAWTVDFYNN